MGTKRKILVVEDNDFVRMQISTFLTSADYEVEQASGGQEALEKIESDIALAVVDVRMEPMGGFEFIRSLRSMAMDIPVVLATGDQDPELLSDSSKLGVSAVLMKPIQKDRLIKTVERTIMMKERAS